MLLNSEPLFFSLACRSKEHVSHKIQRGGPFLDHCPKINPGQSKRRMQALNPGQPQTSCSLAAEQ